MAPNAPDSESMVRNDNNADYNPAQAATEAQEELLGSRIIEIVPLSQQYFSEALEVEKDFQKKNKGCCFGICRFEWCPAPTEEEFASIYQKDPTRRETYGVALLLSSSQSNPNATANSSGSSSSKVVIGICKGRRYGQKMTFEESLLHTPKPGEFYIDSLAVTQQARGKGVGTKLLTWAEELAIQKGDSKLQLGVMKNNPAHRLYKRFGFEDQPTNCFSTCCIGCLIGRPHGSFTGIEMIKDIQSR